MSGQQTYWNHRLLCGVLPLLAMLAACTDAPTEAPVVNLADASASRDVVATAHGPRITGGPLPAQVAELPHYLASGTTPLAPGCDGVPATGTLFAGAEVEPHLAINPLNQNIMVGMWQQDRWSNGGARALISATSTDGGRSWTRRAPPFSRCGGGTLLNGGDYPRASDPWVTYSPNGVVHAMSLSFSGGVFQTGSSNAMLASRSFDNGISWTSAITLISDGSTAFNDKNTMTADPIDANYVYAVWDRLIAANNSGPTYFARTTNGGESWEPARPIHDPGPRNQTIGNVLVVLPSGVLVNVFNEILRPLGGLQVSRVAAVRSLDRGVSWSAPIYLSDFLAIGTRDPESGATVRDGSIIPEMAVSPNGDVYVVWQDSRFNGGLHDAIAISRSSDGGLNWTVAARVNMAANVPAFTPSVHVNRDGVVGVSYYDFRSNTVDVPLLTDYWLARSNDGGQTWTENRIAEPFDLLGAPNANGFFLGDYEGLSSANGIFVPFYAKATADPNNQTEIFAAPLVSLPVAAPQPHSKVPMMRGARAQPMPASYRVSSELRLRVHKNLNKRLRAPPRIGVAALVLPHYQMRTFLR